MCRYQGLWLACGRGEPKREEGLVYDCILVLQKTVMPLPARFPRHPPDGG